MACIHWSILPNSQGKTAAIQWKRDWLWIRFGVIDWSQYRWWHCAKCFQYILAAIRYWSVQGYGLHSTWKYFCKVKPMYEFQCCVRIYSIFLYYLDFSDSLIYSICHLFIRSMLRMINLHRCVERCVFLWHQNSMKREKNSILVKCDF